jgi:hypothetical protein
MAFIRLLLGAALFASSPWADAPAGAVQVKGVEVPATVVSDGHTLTLQGAGVRKKFMFSVYVGALYLTTAASDAAKAIAADEPKRISLRFLRDVSVDAMRDAYEDGFFKNSQEKLDRLRPRIDRLVSFHDRELKEGQTLSYTYLPSTGTRVELDGVEKGAIEGRDFMEALFAIWLGEIPPSFDLKRAMLGER